MALGYILDRFPVLSETFIVRELEGLARAGVRPRLWALREAEGAAPSEAAADLAKGVSVLPRPFSARSVRDRIAALRRSPGRLLAGRAAVLMGSARSPRTFAGEVARSNAAFSLAREIGREGEGESVTHLHAHFGFVPSTVAWLASRVTGVPYSVSVHAWDIFVNRSMMPEKLVAARRVVTCTEYARAFLLERYRALDPGRVVCVHHGIDTRRYSASPLRPGRAFRLLAVGRLAAKKGFAVLLRAFARARGELARDPPVGGEGSDATLVLVGDGPERARLEADAAALGLGAALKMTGPLGPAAVRAEMERAHVLAVPSVRGPRGDMDGLPNVALEAMVVGRPIVGSDLSGIPEAVLEGRTGLLVPPGDEHALARALVRLARDRDLAGRLGCEARRLVEREFSLDLSTRRLMEVFRGMGALD